MGEWKSQQMSFPYWRLYWNKTDGAWIVYKKKIRLTPGKVILIPPNTPFSSDIEGTNVNENQLYSLKGGWVESKKMESDLADNGTVLHMFIHFTLGYPYDTISPDIFEFEITPLQEIYIASITGQLIEGRNKFDQSGSLEVYTLLFSLLNQLPPDIWQNRTLDGRIVNGIRYMEHNIHLTSIRNGSLAEEGRMSVNAYARLFKAQTGYSPKKYLLRMRIEKACNLLHHSDLSIEQIASSCGFSDRYYFTKIFTRIMKITPGIYRKQLNQL